VILIDRSKHFYRNLSLHKNGKYRMMVFLMPLMPESIPSAVKALDNKIC
jgi:hypothetical protein